MPATPDIWATEHAEAAVTMLVTRITYLGKPCTVICDRRCEFAFGISSRPRIQIGADDDDIVYLSDGEVGEAPADPGTYEGGHGKPFHPARHNKWCVRQCERSSFVDPGQPAIPKDWSRRRYNQPWKHGVTNG